MKATDIQKILAEQRVISPIKDLTPAEINRKLSNEAKRKIPLDEYENIIKEYWVRDTVRPLHLANIIAERYGAHTVEKIVINYYKTLPANEYNQLVRTYNNKFGRSALMKQVHAGGNRDKVKAGEAISKAKNTITREDAVVIYELTFSCANSRTANSSVPVRRHQNLSTRAGMANLSFQSDCEIQLRRMETRISGQSIGLGKLMNHWTLGQTWIDVGACF